MSRFKSKQNINTNYLSDKEINFLFSDLDSVINLQYNEILNNLNKFKHEDVDYRVIDDISEIIIVLKKNKLNTLFLHIGYPFPLKTKKELNNYNFDFETNIFIRGEKVRHLQREYLKNRITSTFDTQFIEIHKINDFQDIVAEKIETCIDPHFTFVDNYEFIGDSITNLFFVDYLKNKFNLKNILVISDYNNHLNCFYPSINRKDENLQNYILKSDIIVISDLIDNHFSKSLSIIDVLIEKIPSKQYFVFIISRNVFIDLNGYKSLISFYHFSQADILLKNKNIEDYMKDCIYPFLGEIQLPSVKKTSKFFENLKILIIPYSSDAHKILPVYFILSIIGNLYDLFQNCCFYISKGSNNLLDISWFNLFNNELENIPKKIKQNIIFINDISLSDLYIKISDIQINFALTSDSAFAHSLVRSNIPFFTIYNSSFWDSRSLQSLSAESVLGFCRYTEFQFPIVLTDFSAQLNTYSFYIANAIKNLLKDETTNFNDYSIASICEFNRIIREYVSSDFIKLDNVFIEYRKLKKILKTDKLNWLISFFDIELVFEHIQYKAHSEHLIKSALKISPIYKFEKYKLL